MDPLEKTPLDQALEDVRENPKLANHFYDTFLNSEVFLPVAIIGSENGSWRALQKNERFQPLFLTYQGTKVIPVFDRLDRLKAWSEGRKMDFMNLRCHVLLTMIDAGVSVVLNLATEWSYFFQADILAQLKRSMKPVLTQ